MNPGTMLKMAIQRDRRREITGGVPFSPAQPRAAEQLFPGGYVEDYFDPRTKPGPGRVLARRGRAGE
jgi:hypothetical protein